MTTLSVAYIVRDEISFLPASLEQAEKIADEIVVVLDTRSCDGTREFLKKKADSDKRYVLFEKFWNSGTEQKNFARDKCVGDWILFLDGDEVLSDNCGIIKEVIRDASPYEEAFDLIGHHFIGSLKTEDAASQVHFWEARLIRNLPKIMFVGNVHAITAGYAGFPYGVKTEKLAQVRIFHYGYVKHLQKIIDKYVEDCKTMQLSNHTPAFMLRWKDSHLLGTYPVKEFEGKHPEPILKKFFIKYWDDYAYFKNRANAEVKYFADAHHVIKIFNPKSVLDSGCGMGQRILALRSFGVQAAGFDLSPVAAFFSPFVQDIRVGNVTEKVPFNEKFDLVMAYDLLEHLEEGDLQAALANLKEAGSKDFVFSIPFLGDPNLELDPTHKIKKAKEWWLDQLTAAGFVTRNAPEGFPFREQMVFAVKKA